MAQPVQQATTTPFSIQEVQLIVSATVIKITDNIGKSLLEVNQDAPHGFKLLAEKNIVPTLEEDFKECDQTIQLIYAKVFKATLEHIRMYSEMIFMTLGLINTQTRNDQAGGQFLGSFVYPAVQTMIEELMEKQPEALTRQEILK